MHAIKEHFAALESPCTVPGMLHPAPVMVEVECLVLQRGTGVLLGFMAVVLAIAQGSTEGNFVQGSHWTPPIPRSQISMHRHQER